MKYPNIFFQKKSGARGIHTAAMKGHVSVINTLLQKGENVDAVTNVSRHDNHAIGFVQSI